MKEPDRHKSSSPPVKFDGLVFTLFLLIYIVSAMSFAAADWADHLAVLPIVALLAVLSGALLARSRFSGGVAALFSAVYGLYFIGWLLGHTLDPALNWPERAASILGRLRAFLVAVGAGQPSRDTLMFVLLMCLLYWAFAAQGAWALLRKGHLWRAVIPPGLFLLVDSYYYLGHARLDIYVAAFVLLVILLINRYELDSQNRLWRSRRLRVPAGLGLRAVQIGTIAALVLVSAAWVGPAFAQSGTAEQLWTNVSGPWRTLRSHLSNMVAGLRSPVVYVGDSYGATLSLNAGIEPSNDLVMVVKPAAQVKEGGRFYWQARTYNVYQDGTWSQDIGIQQSFDPLNGNLPLPSEKSRQNIDVTFEPHFSLLNRMYVPADTRWVSRSASVTAIQSGGKLEDVTSFVSKQTIYDGEVYQARASIAVPTANGLRQAGLNYPDWVVQNYLQVPPGLESQFKQLAESITSPQTTPFDQAQAVTSWLRSNIEYSRVIQAPPTGQDPLSWFLFDYRIGFCNYYASAEVMLLRSLGIPSRIAVGYAMGEYDSSNNVYDVHAIDSHAWPEVYFPGYGWVPFEPTVSQPVLRRPIGAPLAGQTQTPDLTGGAGNSPSLEDLLSRVEEGQPIGSGGAGSVTQGPAWYGPIILAMLAALVLFLFALAVDPAWRLTSRKALVRGFKRAGLRLPRRWEWEGALDSETARAYLEWSSWLVRLGLPIDPSETPFERLRTVKDGLPMAGSPSDRIVRAFVAERFGGQSPDPIEVRDAWREAHALFWRAWLGGAGRRILRWIRNPRARHRIEAKA